MAAAFGLSSDQYRAAIVDLNEALVANNHIVPDTSSGDDEEDEEQKDEVDDLLIETERSRHEALLSYCVGVAFGRWDVRMALDTSLVPKISNTFDSLPKCPPGTLLGPDGLPAKRGSIVSRD